MKKWLALLLVVIITACIVAPCCAADDCCAGSFVNKDASGDDPTEEACSPFFACAGCAGSIELTKHIQLPQPVVATAIHYAKAKVLNPLHATRICWQPPRSC